MPAEEQSMKKKEKKRGGIIESEGKCGGVHDSRGTRSWKNNI